MIIAPSWPCPSNVHALISTRNGGVSQAPYNTLNLAVHVGDQPDYVERNRAILSDSLPTPPVWIKQVHSTDVIELKLACVASDVIEADAVISSSARQVCGVLTADCMPVLFCNTEGTRVAAAHAGWRGLLDGVLQNTLEAFGGDHDQVMAFIGPSITQDYYQVGEEVVELFKTKWETQFGKSLPQKLARKEDGVAGKFLLDLAGIACHELNNLGVKSVYREDYCTWRDNHLFYSYRKEGVTGRFATLIWFE